MKFSTVVSYLGQEILPRWMPIWTMASVTVMAILQTRVLRSPSRKWSSESWCLAHLVLWRVTAWTGAVPISRSPTTARSLTPTTWQHLTFRSILLTAKQDWEHVIINPVCQIASRNGKYTDFWLVFRDGGIRSTLTGGMTKINKLFTNREDKGRRGDKGWQNFY